MERKKSIKFMIGFIQIIIKRTRVENMKSAAVPTPTKEPNGEKSDISNNKKKFFIR